MRALKFIGFVLLSFLVIALILPMIMHKEVTTSQSMIIEASPAVVFRQVNDLNNWKNWSPFSLDDSRMSLEFSGSRIGEGARLNWTSKDQGSGGLKIIKSEPYALIQSDLDFGNYGDATDEWVFVETDEGVKVSWSLKLSDLSYPFGRYFGFFLDGLMNPLQEKGLNKLKLISEKADKPLEITQTEKKAILGVGIQDTIQFADRKDFIVQNQQKLEEYFSSLRYQPAGDAFLLLKPVQNGFFFVRFGYPVYDEVRESGLFRQFEIPEQKVIQSEIIWNDSAAEVIHSEMQLYLEENKLKSDQILEEYFTVGNDNLVRVSYYLLP
jgi:hypothetical protein